MPGGRPIAALACALALAAAAPAQAKPPPKGKYDCTIGEGTLFGTLAIKAGNAYSHRGSKGTFRAKGSQVRFPDGIKGWRISFKGGGLAGMKGRWYKGSDGTPSGNYEIALKNPGSGFESIYCSKRK